jgi:segregation and condensation protein A
MSNKQPLPSGISTGKTRDPMEVVSSEGEAAAVQAPMAEAMEAVHAEHASDAMKETHASGKPQTGIPQTMKDAAVRPDAKKEEASQSPFSITVGQVYEGPLDLLLDLIRKQDLDIYDIPIAKITAQFLSYCEQLKQTDVDAAGEFIYTASLLIHIKSKMLLPRDPSDVAGEAEDPRRELVERLLEHEKFKNAAQMLMQKQHVEEATWTNPGAREFREDEGAEPEIAADTVDLVRVFQEILERLRTRPVLDVNEEAVTVAQMLDYIKRRLVMEDRPVSLRKLLHSTHSERALICMFLALLELVRLQAVLLRQQERFGDILIKKGDGFDAVVAEQAQVRDDWK